MTESSFEFERDLRVRSLLLDNEDAIRVSYERLVAVSTSQLATWWYIFWVSQTDVESCFVLMAYRTTCGDETTIPSAH